MKEEEKGEIIKCTRCKNEKPSSEYYRIYGRIRKECKKCSSDRALKYRQNNREKIRIKKREWSLANIEHIREYGKSYREAHRSQRREAQRRYANSNRDMINERSRESTKILSDSYIKMLITTRNSLKRGDLKGMKEMIDTYRTLLLLKRNLWGRT